MILRYNTQRACGTAPKAGLLLAFGLILFFLLPPSWTPRSTAAPALNHPLSSPMIKHFLKSKPLIRHDGEKAPPPAAEVYNLSTLTNTKDAITRGERVLVLTPLAVFYQDYWDNLVNLSYPHELISLGFIIPQNEDGDRAFTELERAANKTQRQGEIGQRFASITILRQEFEAPHISQDEERHKLEIQKVRRESMARARNSLLFTMISPTTSWVLWVDADIIETPSALVQDLISHEVPVVQPNCFKPYYNTDTNRMDERPYDYNAWRDSDDAARLAESMGSDDILLEGYEDKIPTHRSRMAFMADRSNPDPTRIIELDGVGGTVLMVRAEVHRHGAVFPAFPFDHHVETEGFAKMAKRLGYSLYGLPDYEVRSLGPSFLLCSGMF